MNSCKCYIFTATVTVLFVFIWSSFGFAFGDDKQARNSLRGLKNIGIVVNWDSEGLEEERLNSIKEKIKIDVNYRFKSQGIKMSSGASDNSPPYFCLEIESLKCDNNTHALYITAKAMQEVVLKNKKSVQAISPTWSSGGILGIIVEESIQDAVSKLVNEFVKAYLSVNPKENMGKDI